VVVTLAAVVGVLTGLRALLALTVAGPTPVLEPLTLPVVSLGIEWSAGAPWPALALTVAALSTALYAALALVLSVRVLGRQSLDAKGRGGLRRLFHLATAPSSALRTRP